MVFACVTFTGITEEQKEVLTALLSEIGFEGYEETDTEFKAFIGKEVLDIIALDSVVENLALNYTLSEIEPQNWNALWEGNFEPVIVDDFCAIRADFHGSLKDQAKYEIVITPKMSFGTGHHATTYMMIQLMRNTPMQGKSVLDYGCGTGVLAILAERLGAVYTMAIDIDEWAYQNTLENVLNNNCKKIEVVQGELDRIDTRTFDIILANINKHVLQFSMEHMYRALHSEGVLLLSGILHEDEDDIVSLAVSCGFRKLAVIKRGSWMAISFTRGYE
jgi:ribosomal protein L11 methyltransferase